MHFNEQTEHQKTFKSENIQKVEENGNQRCAVFFTCITAKRPLIHSFALLLVLVLLYATLYGMINEYALPGNAVFALLLLVVCCYIGGRIIRFLNLPPLIGMLITGFLYRNLPFVTYYKDIPNEWSSILRNTALGIIFLRAGLGLDPYTLKKMSCVCFRLALIPCLTETAAAALISHFLLHIPWALSFCLGFILSATTPAVVIPSMMILEKKGYGADKGITTIVTAASSIDDVFAITGFSICLGIAFSQGNMAWIFLKGPLGVVIGMVYGTITGLILWYIPHHAEERKVYYRGILLSLAGLAVAFLSERLNFASAGAIGCLTIAFVAAIRWRKEEDSNKEVEEAEDTIWCILQTFLFGLTGAEVSLGHLERNIGYCALTLLVGLAFRIISTYVAVIGAGLNFKEKIFLTLAWLPKATVQAAIGSSVLDMARMSKFGQNYINYGDEILTVSVLSILVTAPLGAIIISLLGPVLLEKKQQTTDSVSANEEQRL